MAGQEALESPDEEEKTPGCFLACSNKRKKGPKAKKTRERKEGEKCERKKKGWGFSFRKSKGSAGGLNQGEETSESPQDLAARKKDGLNQGLESETHQTSVPKGDSNEGQESESSQAQEARQTRGLNQELESELHQAPELVKKYDLNQAQASDTCQTSEMKVKESLNHEPGSQTPTAPELGWKDHLTLGQESQILRAPELGLKDGLNQGQGSQIPRVLEVGFKCGFNQEQQPQNLQGPAPREKSSLNRGLEPDAQRDQDAHKGCLNQGEKTSESPQDLAERKKRGLNQEVESKNHQTSVPKGGLNEGHISESSQTEEARRKGGLNQGLECERHQASQLGKKYELYQIQASDTCQTSEMKVKESLNLGEGSQIPRALEVGFKCGFNQGQQPQTLQGPEPRKKNSLNQGLEPEAQRDPGAKDTDAEKGGLNQGWESSEYLQEVSRRKKGGLNQGLESETDQTKVPKDSLNEEQESESPQALEGRKKCGLSQGLESELHQAPELVKKYDLNQAQASGTSQTSEMKVKESLNHELESQTPTAPELGWKDHLTLGQESQILQAPELGLKDCLNQDQGLQIPRALEVGFKCGFNQGQQPQTLQGPALKEKNSLNQSLEPEAQRDPGTKDPDAHTGGLNQGWESSEYLQEVSRRKKGGLNQGLESETDQTKLPKDSLNKEQESESPHALEGRKKCGLSQGLESELHQAPELVKKYDLNQVQASGTSQTSEMKVKESLNHEPGSQTPTAPELGWKDHLTLGQESQILQAPELGLKDCLNQDQGLQIPRALEVGFKCGFNQGQQPQTLQDPEPRKKNSLNQGLEPEAQRDPEAKDPDAHKGRRAFHDLFCKLEMEKHQNKKFRLSNVLEVCPENTKVWTAQTVGDLPWHFLRKVMSLNVMARNTSLINRATDDSEDWVDDEGQGSINFSSCSDIDAGASVNPLDVLCAVLLCSDSFLQQEILSKMSMCQFALPLLLPALDTPKCTLMLWAMRDIVRKWRPHSLAESRGFREESLVLTSMPTFSFVRMGSCSFSKSKLLNEVLSPSQQHHDFFIHWDMESGNVPREIADGLVEISWYFPSGLMNSDLFPEPVAVTNLRGDIESHWLQFSFLTKISSAVFIVTESISEKQYALLSSLQGSATKYYFILSGQSGNFHETQTFLKKLTPILKLKKSQLLMKDNVPSMAKFVKKLQSTIEHIMNSSQKKMGIEDMVIRAHELGIQVDEDCEECRSTRKYAKEISAEIKDVVKYKKDRLKLQGELWKNLTEVEKELCQMKKRRDTNPEVYKSQLRMKLLELRREQNLCGDNSVFKHFINRLRLLHPVEKHYFLKWMKFNLDHIARGNLSRLRAEYRQQCETLRHETQQLAQLDKLISDGSLGVEHFMRELGQFYEAECSMIKEGIKAEKQRQFTLLPGIAAELMLEGFPMELIDGDAANIPLQWVTDVLTELHVKLGGRSRMLVLTVLGVQSTGKSTLLNTMFGLQFAVSSGRCTRGAFMSLIKVSENFQQELGCDFILVIDTEGLKAPELALLEDSYEHDNELATLVIGLSDITIVNMAMENATEMKDILQIVVHAFLRMEEIGQKPNCQFVHQNVSDVSAHDQNIRDRKRLLEQLDEMTKAAARMENQFRETSFTDVMDYDPEKHNWYIPGLWQGVPPMSPVNLGYSENIYKLKKYLFEFMRECSHSRSPKDIPQFTEWLKSLWNAVKHENFIFSFRNSLVADAYNQLSVRYAEWEWDFRKQIHLWVSEKETYIQNQLSDKLDADFQSNLNHAADTKLQHEQQHILNSLQQYFQSEAANLHLIEKYREDFIRSTNGLRKKLEKYAINKCEEMIRLQKCHHKIDNNQAIYMKTIEGKVDGLLGTCRKRKQQLDNRELETEFEKMWQETLSELPALTSLKKQHICEDMEMQLREDLDHRGSTVRHKLQEIRSLLNYRIHSFTMKNEYWAKDIQESFNQECWYKAESISMHLMDQCKSYAESKVNSKGDYDETYCRELLHMINKTLQEKDVQNLHTSTCFEVDLKLHILGEAAWRFKAMHEDFINEHDPKQRLEKLKSQYLSIFKDLYWEKDSCQNKARDFCDRCLKPALVDYVNKRLGIEIVDNILRSGQSIEYSSRSFFQFTVLKKLLEERDFESYVKYINNYEQYVKSWIWKHILNYYGETQGLVDLEKGILSTIMKKVRDALKISGDKKTSTVSTFLDGFCKVLQQELVLSRDSLAGIQFRNTANIHQFSEYIQFFLPKLEQQILSQSKAVKIESKLSTLPLKPEDEIFKRVFGCGRQCPFCKVPCEVVGTDHREHFASVHRPQGLAQYKNQGTKKLDCSLCSSNVVSTKEFKVPETKGKFHPYKNYQRYYPDWRIQPDSSITASDYWKFVLKLFNNQFAERYHAEPADLPDDWKNLTEERALDSIKEAYGIK